MSKIAWYIIFLMSVVIFVQYKENEENKFYHKQLEKKLIEKGEKISKE